jgi:hypothetical protein
MTRLLDPPSEPPPVPLPHPRRGHAVAQDSRVVRDAEYLIANRDSTVYCRRVTGLIREALVGGN